MLPTASPLILFTDLDGCLLNKHDYDWSPASATLDRLRQRQIPVVMNSSKTVPEMTLLADELGLSDNTFVSENGSVIRWGQDAGDRSGEIEIIGAARDQILEVLRPLKQSFRFRSFADLGLDGVIRATQLSEDRSQLALARQGTEPLLWDDSDENRVAFERHLDAHQLTLTKGGRFWHVAGPTSKGKAMQVVAERLSLVMAGCESGNPPIIAAIGDSPIDQSMLDLADVPIGIPTASGLGVDVAPDRGIVASAPGAAGWAEAVTELLARIDIPTADSLPNPLPRS
ncbi:Glucosyl-3-phosphoglycerate/mannosyl-3-phosphoglycerate phosphatase [Stieleria maiorica]|uniref:Glucosyl-3-phosphoglycerate/mannosyl-3-phosphoglycerate phosphatase n=1 Tax=Stieleria maiorica TaxID=2795974 RepID=A0A5B9MHD6_9BACT|nr:HAD-IIB family hydrolase [Stieleria maiorica]QEF98497.1 Glucosyl-3-phosphoglycerate/mannosyl-3-phosphoglycerate phosphatase [Stieleria maiorica]